MSVNIFKRQREVNLDAWKTKPGRKPLIIRGARQVGKTTLIKQFAASYKHQILLNLEKQADASLFKNIRDIRIIVESLFLSKNIPVSSLSETILFIDEIQELPDVIQLLRYFYEDYPDLHVIAAGSLLEFAMKKVKSFPVGRVEFLYLHPLNFPEYLNATGKSAALGEMDEIPCASFAHPILLNLFHQFVITGGMPEVIAEYIEKESLTELPVIYESLWETFRNDVEKYADNDTERKVIKHIMAVAHLYIDQRVKFQNFGQSNYRSREVGEAFRNLDDAKVIQLLYPTTSIEVPAKPDLRKSPRLQFLDTGMINHALGIQGDLMKLNDLSRAWKGTVIPHIIAQEILSLNIQSYRKPLFWVREKKQSSAEVDMVVQFHDKVIPVEIKSGSEGTLRSLHQFVEATNHPYAVRMYAGEFKVSKTKTTGGKPFLLMNLPYYLGTKINSYLEYFLGSYKL
jgi:uncharacterized protein